MIQYYYVLALKARTDYMFCAGFFHTRKNLKNFSKEVIKSHLAVLIWCGKRDKHFSNHKGKEVRLMKPSDFQKTVQCRFESCLKKVVRSVVKDYYKELNRRKNKEISFSELPDVLVDKMAVWDDYETDYTIFSVCGIDIRVLDDELAEALKKLPERKRNTLLMYYLIFRGSDYIEAQKIPKLIINNLYNCTKKIGNKLGKMNYRGICGLDFIVQNNKLYFIEINPRFQGSSFLINRTLFENNLPSLYELNEMAFSNEPIKIEKKKLENLNINYSYYKIKYSKNIAVEYFNKLCNCKDIDKYFMDGLNIQNNIQLRGYMFRFISKRNIISLNPNHQINIYQNLLSNEIIRCSIKDKMDWNNLKTALLLQEIKIDISAMIALTECGGIQEGTFDAIDIRFSNDLIVNCPLKIPFIDFSPFTLKYIEKNFYLFYLEKNISIVYVDKKDSIPNVKTHSGLLYSKMVQRNNMRIRIRHNSICLFKQNGKGCHFCHAKNEEYYNFDLDDITESFLFYLENFEFKEIMIGGASNDRIYEPTLIKDILKIIRIHTDKPIYIMSLPPQDLNDIQEYKKLGANEIAFNLEIYDETISKEIMPGKGMISRNEYLKALYNVSTPNNPEYIMPII